ncbi:multidrug effflux MFS transporter [Candidatus Tokpelaia sp.]|uniref:multidrug effflux MFS transporter n=1 Tax=Candidatus Tokpelaia sp. TaxID=2233777 RepID=UPI0012388E5F|nr:multidrug effflux MFS transporter [Candidatus Tokpelaia sp.]KAA6404826.1 Bcr/CflA family drug resistance efflux transporter [Candidatus Tokpelaia sp.]
MAQNPEISAADQENHIEAVKARIGRKEFVVLMAVLMATNAYAIDIMLPALEQIKTGFDMTGLNRQHYVIFAFLVGFALAQLFFGPLSDCFGRRLPLIVGLALYTIFSFACARAPDFETLLILRAVQGVGAAATRAITVSIIRDMYHGRKMAEILSIVMMIFMIVPIIAPACGNLILSFGTWRSIFNIMTYAGLATILWVLWRLPETVCQKRPFSFGSIGSAFAHVLRNRIALCYSLAFSVMLGALFCSLTTAPQIYEGIYHLGAWFPAAFAAVAAFQALAAYGNARLVLRFGMHSLSHGLLLSFIAASFIWFIWSWAAIIVPFPAHMVLFTIIMFSFGAIGANFNSLAMEPLGQYAGTASSVFGFMQTLIGALLGIIISQSFNGTTLPIAADFMLLGLIALALVLLAEKGKLFDRKSAASGEE